MRLIKKASILVNEAVKIISHYQKGEDTPIKTRYELLNRNCLGGIFKSMILTIGGISGSGKSHLLQQIEEDIFNEELNPHAEEYVLLRCNWEMQVYKLILRRLQRELKKPISEILFKKLEADERLISKKICDIERSPNIYYLEDPVTPKQWYEELKAFLKEHKNKRQVVVTIDHIALVRDLGSKKKSMDDLLEYVNALKKEFSNVSFIILTQLNRDIESRSDVRYLAPQRGDIYNTDALYHITDILLIVHNPYRLHHSKYMVVGRAEYPEFSEYMVKGRGKTANFHTKYLLFHHYLKIRDMDNIENTQNLDIICMSPTKFKEEFNTNLYNIQQEEADTPF